MQTYVEEQGPFNVIGVYRAEFGKRTVKILSPNNSLAYAQHMVELIKGELATKEICGESGKVMTDAYLEPAGCPRPLSPELQAMMHRETARRTIEDVAHGKNVKRVDYLRGELTRMGVREWDGEVCDSCGGRLGNNAPLYEDADICRSCHTEIQAAEVST